MYKQLDVLFTIVSTIENSEILPDPDHRRLSEESKFININRPVVFAIAVVIFMYEYFLLQRLRKKTFHFVTIKSSPLTNKLRNGFGHLSKVWFGEQITMVLQSSLFVRKKFECKTISKFQNLKRLRKPSIF